MVYPALEWILSFSPQTFVGHPLHQVHNQVIRKKFKSNDAPRESTGEGTTHQMCHNPAPGDKINVARGQTELNTDRRASHRIPWTHQ